VKGHFIFNIVKEFCGGISLIEFADNLFTGRHKNGGELCIV